MTIEDLKDSMTQEEMYSWMRYYTQEPFGALIATRNAAVMSQCMLAPHTKRIPKAGDMFPELANLEKTAPVKEQMSKIFTEMKTYAKADGKNTSSGNKS